MATSAATAQKREIISLYRSLLKNAIRFPLASRRDVVTEEVKGTFRANQFEELDGPTLEYRLTLGWERNAAIAKYAENMHWFHSRDEVTKEMLHFSQQRDQEKREAAERANRIGRADIKTHEVTEFKSALYHVHPDYYNKVETTPLTHSRDVWRCRGSYGSDTGGPRQKFYVKRYKAVFPQGW